MTEALPFLNQLNQLPGIQAAWIGRISEIDVKTNRDEAMLRLRTPHENFLTRNGFLEDHELPWRAEQVHGAAVAVVPQAEQILAKDGWPIVPGVDGLITAHPNLTLLVYVADCGPIWLADPVKRVVAVLHSGKKGTEGNILQVAVSRMQREFGCEPRHLLGVLGPSIRPPHYEIDFARTINAQASAAGLGHFHDCGVNTADDLAAHYSYRAEKGETGRMVAAIRLLW